MCHISYDQMICIFKEELLHQHGLLHEPIYMVKTYAANSHAQHSCVRIQEKYYFSSIYMHMFILDMFYTSRLHRELVHTS